MTSTLSHVELAKYAADFHAHRHTKGHFDGGDYLKDVDGYGGKKHRAMEKIAKHYSEKGQNRSAADLLKFMGKPDEIIPKIEATTVGPKAVGGPDSLTGRPNTGLEEAENPLGPGAAKAPGEAGAENAQTGNYFAVYYWRGKHDYLWFEIVKNGNDEVVKG
ncbi:hypothetical protein HDV00_000470 [Rhizophlyctis rosea]|nr:hypothetical protein HDV00_000470 [Rhizophlyctis rosea]